MAVPHAPMQEKIAPTQQKTCARFIITVCPPFYKGRIVFIMGCAVVSAV